MEWIGICRYIKPSAKCVTDQNAFIAKFVLMMLDWKLFCLCHLHQWNSLGAALTLGNKFFSIWNTLRLETLNLVLDCLLRQFYWSTLGIHTLNHWDGVQSAENRRCHSIETVNFAVRPTRIDFRLLQKFFFLSSCNRLQPQQGIIAPKLFLLPLLCQKRTECKLF